jgi:hypothetical protein
MTIAVGFRCQRFDHSSASAQEASGSGLTKRVDPSLREAASGRLSFCLLIGQQGNKITADVHEEK